MRAVDVMTSEVATVRPDTPLAEAVAKMVHNRISGLPVVVASGAVVGMLTEGDLLRRVELSTAPQHAAWLAFLRGPDLAAAEYVRTHSRTVDDLMTPTAWTVDAEAPLQEVVRLMRHHRIRRVPVLRDGKLVGIVTRADLVRALAVAMQPKPAVERADHAIQADICAALKSAGWAGGSAITVDVVLGRVQLTGVAYSEAVRMAVRAAAELVPGVVAVENEIVVEPPGLTIGA